MRKFEGFQRGVNLGGWVSQCVSRDKEHFETFITKKDIEQIAGWGLDHVRLPIDYDIVMNEDDTFIEDGFALIDQCIEWCRSCGLHIILDVHKAKGYMFDTNEIPDPDAFFHSSELQDSFIHLWEELARRYAKDSDVAAFELLNEIVSPAMGEIWNGIARRTIEAIRDIAPDTYILIGGVCYNSVANVPDLDAPYDDHIVYNFHCYAPLMFTHQGAYWVADMPRDFRTGYPQTAAAFRAIGETVAQARVDAVCEDFIDPQDSGAVLFEKMFADAVAYADRMNVPLYCGEYGVIDLAPLPDTVRWFDDIHSVFEKFGIGRALWNYKNKDFGLVDEHYAPVRDELVKRL